MLLGTGVVARGCVDHYGFEGLRVACVDQLNPAVDLIQVDLLALDRAVVGLPNVWVAGIRLDQFYELLTDGEVIEHGHRSNRLADTAFATTHKHDGRIHVTLSHDWT